eukprot:TRINITY_DN26239_c0_g3_i1.p1 TRINITY_DN26239_c0_g3~~TRINITY_DN26239_c0_g3_i1.p1  ORF type:complete len:129 (+),score=37.20 TRINITY_DN26239_c0_g3_i1:273-659(+)
MHPRNRYKAAPPDFKALAQKYPRFAPYVSLGPSGDGYASIDWKEPKALLELTRALLHQDFDLDWDMPLDRLCPTVTSRLNYIHWMEDLVGSRIAVSYTHLRAHETPEHLVCRLLLEKKKKKTTPTDKQ